MSYFSAISFTALAVLAFVSAICLLNSSNALLFGITKLANSNSAFLTLEPNGLTASMAIAIAVISLAISMRILSIGCFNENSIHFPKTENPPFNFIKISSHVFIKAAANSLTFKLSLNKYSPIAKAANTKAMDATMPLSDTNAIFTDAIPAKSLAPKAANNDVPAILACITKPISETVKPAPTAAIMPPICVITANENAPNNAAPVNCKTSFNSAVWSLINTKASIINLDKPMASSISTIIFFSASPVVVAVPPIVLFILPNNLSTSLP